MIFGFLLACGCQVVCGSSHPLIGVARLVGLDRLEASGLGAPKGKAPLLTDPPGLGAWGSG